MSDWMSGVKRSGAAASQTSKGGSPVGTVACPSLCLPDSFLCLHCVTLLCICSPEDFPTVGGQGLVTEELLSPRRAAEQKCGGSWYQRGAGSRADPSWPLCLGSMMLSRAGSCMFLLLAVVLSGWLTCRPGAFWSLERVQQDLQNGISFCPCSLSLYTSQCGRLFYPMVLRVENPQEAVLPCALIRVLCFKPMVHPEVRPQVRAEQMLALELSQSPL